MRTLRSSISGAAAVAVAFAIACSGGDGSTGDATSPVGVGESVTVAAAPTETATATATATATTTGSAGTSALPPVTLAGPAPTGGGAEPHFTVVAGEAVVDGDQVQVTFEVGGAPPAELADLLLYSAILHFEGHHPSTQAPINIAGGPSWYILGSSAFLFVQNANTEDPSRPLTLGGALDRGGGGRMFTLTTRLPAAWPRVVAVYAQVNRFQAPYEDVGVSGPAFRVEVREGDLSPSALATPEDIPFPPPTAALDPSTYAVQLSLPADWIYTNLGSEGYDAASSDGSALAGVGVVADLDAETVLRLIVEESAGAYALDDPDAGAIGPFPTSIMVRATQDYQVAPGASAVFLNGWYSTAGNTLLLAAATHDGVTYLAYLEVPEGSDLDEWRSILEGATFR